MKFIERFRRNPENFHVESQGNALELIQAIQRNFPQRSQAIDYLANLLTEKNEQLAYTQIPTITSLFDFVKDKRTLLDENGNFKITEKEIPEYLQKYLQAINSGRLMTTDVKTIIDQAFFILIHPPKKGNKWVSLGHHNFTTYRGNMYGPGWAEPKYGIFSDKPRGFDIEFRIATGFDPKEILNQYYPKERDSSKITQVTFGSNQVSFSADNQPGNYRTAYVPINVEKWNTYDIQEGSWKKGWKVFGISGGVILKEIEASETLTRQDNSVG